MREFIKIVEDVSNPEAETEEVLLSDLAGKFVDQLVPLALNPKTATWIDTVLRKHVVTYQTDDMEYQDDRERLWNSYSKLITFLNEYPPGPNTTVREARNASKDPSLLHHGHNQQRVNIDSPEFKAWFGASKVVDFHGDPLIVFRGTNKVPKADHFATRRTIPSFSTSADIASVYSSSPTQELLGGEQTFNRGATVSPCYLSIQKPLMLTNGSQVNLDELCYDMGLDLEDGDTWTFLNYLLHELERRDADGGRPFEFDAPFGPLGRMDLDDLRERLERAHLRGNADRFADLCSDTSIDAYAIVDTPIFLRYAEQQGFDGVIHLDVFTEGAKAAPGLLGRDAHGVDEEESHLTYRPFRQNQIKSIFNRGSWNTDNDNISEAVRSTK